MLGDASLAGVPLAALSGGVEYTRYVSASALATDAEDAVAIFTPSVTATGTGTDSVLVAASIFNAALSATATGTDAVSSLAGFAPSVTETSTGTDSSFVEPSIFNATVEATATGADAVLAYAVYISVVSGGALAVDAVAQRLLWEVINDYQPSSWTLITTQS